MTTTSAPRTDFAELSHRIKSAGLLERRPGYYALRLSLVALFFIGGWTAFALIGPSWWTVAVAVWLGVAYAQLALVAHDLAHRQVFRTAAASGRAGLIAGNFGIGMSYGYWQNKHTRHHANPNHDDLDPDVGPGVIVWTREAAAARPNWLTRNQAWLFFPLLTLLGLSLRRDSIQALRRDDIAHKAKEGVLLGVHIVGYLTALLVVLTPLQALVFFVVHQALFGVYLGMTFAPNHKGMPHPDGTEDFLRKQVLTSRNVRGGLLTDVALGGLNYQIEHHLFPSMPTPNLRRAQPIVRDFCAEIGVPYEMTGLLESYRQALSHLHGVSRR
jgi:fatty acid desaturase